MWLPKDERRTLVIYYRKWTDGGISIPLEEPWDEKAHLRLRDRGLIVLDTKDVFPWRVGLTSEGRQLGEKYNSWWLWTNLWYTEYIKNHWVCVVGSFFGGILVTLVLQWLSKTFM